MLAMTQQLQLLDAIKPSDVLIKATIENTCIVLVMIAALKGYQL